MGCEVAVGQRVIGDVACDRGMLIGNQRRNQLYSETDHQETARKEARRHLIIRTRSSQPAEA